VQNNVLLQFVFFLYPNLMDQLMGIDGDTYSSLSGMQVLLSFEAEAV